MINLNAHLSASSIGSFSNKVIPSPQTLIGEYACIIDKILLLPRSGWLLRKIPANLAETISAHCIKVAIATHLVINGTDYNISQEEKSELILTAGLHDLGEWKAPDYTPHDITNGVITEEGKYNAELESLRQFGEKYSDSLPMKLWSKLEKHSNKPNYKLIHELDKLDAVVMALNYDSYGYDVEEFLPYTRSKLTDPLLISAFEWLVQREFPTIDYFYQYCIFLAYNGNLDIVRSELYKYQ